MRFDPGNAQHSGSRQDQQDAFAFSDPADTRFIAHGGLLAVLADGMGGMEHGAEASRAAVRTFLQSYARKLPGESIPDALRRSLDSANAAVYEIARGSSGAGTTLVAAVLHDSGLYWISAGDSGLYVLRNGYVTLLNARHNYGRELDASAASGRISEAEALAHPERDSLTSYLGARDVAEIDANPEPLPLAPNDRVLLASDGLFRTLADHEIASAVSGESQAACDELVRRVLAKQAHYQDNVTVMLIGVDGRG